MHTWLILVPRFIDYVKSIPPQKLSTAKGRIWSRIFCPSFLGDKRKKDVLKRSSQALGPRRLADSPPHYRLFLVLDVGTAPN